MRLSSYYTAPVTVLGFIFTISLLRTSRSACSWILIYFLHTDHPISHDSPSINTSNTLTGAVSELEAQVGPSETVDGNRQFDHLAPSRAVVMVEHKGAVLWHVGLT